MSTRTTAQRAKTSETTGRAVLNITNLGFTVYGSGAAAAVTGDINGEGYDLVNVSPSILPDEDENGPLSGGRFDPELMGPAVIQPIYDVIAAAFDGSPPGDYEHAATKADMKRAAKNLRRAVRKMR